MSIDWETPLAGLDALAGDGLAKSIAANLRTAGNEYRIAFANAGNPSTALSETAAHAAWRANMVTTLTRKDKVAQQVDGKPLTSIDSGNPTTAIPIITARLTAAQRQASGDALKQLVSFAIAASLPHEPKPYEATAGGQRLVDVEIAVLAGVNVANLYLGIP